MRVRALLLSALTAVALAAAVSPAHASRSQFSIFDASEEFSGSLCCPGLSSSALDDADALGADSVRVLVHWRDLVVSPLATTKPAGDSGDPAWPGYGQPTAASSLTGWGRYDDVVRGAVARGMSVLLVPTGNYPDGRVPVWAGHGANGTDPDPTEYGRFLKALAVRYRGGYDPDGGGGLAPIPAASYVGVWNEPNSPFQLAPQQKDGVAYTPGLYRQLYISGRQGLLDGGFRGQIWIGELAPRGTDTTLGAIPFTEQMLCLKAKKRKKKGKKGKVRFEATCGALQADAFAHHPHTGVDPPFQPPFARGDIDIANLPVLVKLLKRAAKAGAINSLPLILDEYGVQSNPPDPLFGKSFQAQAEYIGIAEFLAWRNPDIAGWSQYLDRDDVDQGGFQSGLRLRDGSQKPAFDAFRTPLAVRKLTRCSRKSASGKCVTTRPAKSVKVWGEVRPAGNAHVQLEQNDGSGWRPATPTFTTDAGGYVQRKLRYRRNRAFRLLWLSGVDGIDQCGGKCTGPAIRAYSFK